MTISLRSPVYVATAELEVVVVLLYEEELDVELLYGDVELSYEDVVVFHVFQDPQPCVVVLRDEDVVVCTFEVVVDFDTTPVAMPARHSRTCQEDVETCIFVGDVVCQSSNLVDVYRPFLQPNGEESITRSA